VTIGLGVRERHLARLPREKFDVAIVGGGITGAGIALDLAARGLSVALVDRADFAAGTSSRSSKLIHGGLRYLAQFQFGVTREALHERHVLQRLAPGLVEPMPFVIPVVDGLPAAARLAFGLTLYDLLAGAENTRPFWHIAPAKLPRLAPGLRTDGISTAYVYHDCRTDDARLTLAVLAQAAARGAALVNHVAVTAVDGSRLRLRDRQGGGEMDLSARQVVLATGAWADRDLPVGGASSLPVKPSKGVHLFLPSDRLLVRTAFYLSTGLDDRLVFVVPWLGRTLVGTTDTDYAGDLAAPTVEPADLEYLLGVLRRHFPGRHLSEDDVVGAQAGLRPLVRAGGRPTAASREEHVWERPDGSIAIAGGKLTTYRRMAEKVGDRVAARLGAAARSSTHEIALTSPSGDAAAAELAGLVAARPKLSEPIVRGQAPTRAEVVVAARHGQARRIGDVLARRTRLLLLDHRGATAAAPMVAGLMGDELGWSAEQRRVALAEFADEARQYGLPTWRT
jgi:glycerol-3-phosphate dehydrogenase